MLEHRPPVVTTGPLERRLAWMDRGTALFEATLAGIGDEELSLPSALPRWTRLHVVSHMARNARGLVRLLRWAETGIETPMYPSREARDADIEEGARLAAGGVRADALAAAARLGEAISALPEAAWGAEVRNALGQAVPAVDIPWMRVREVWIHAVDLDAGASFEDIDPEVAAALLDEAVRRAGELEGCPPLLLELTGGGTLATGRSSKDASRVAGSAQALLGWMLGRTGGAGLESAGPLPVPPPWL